MSKRTYIWDSKTKKLVEVFRVRREPVAPVIRCDTIDEYCHGTGRHYTSRSERNRDLKMYNIEPVTENEFQNFRPKPGPTIEQREEDLKETLEKSYYDIRDSRAEGLSEKDKQLCKEIDAGLSRKP